MSLSSWRPSLRLPMLLVVVLPWIQTGCTTPEETGRWQGPFFFLQMADPQLGMWTADASFERETKLFEEAIAHANRLKPAFVVVCGDLVNRPGDPEQTQELLRIAGQLDGEIPLYWVSGNHDIGNEPTPESLSWYRKTLGEDWYSFRYGGWAFIVLNSTIIHKPDKVREEVEKQREWLRRELEVAGEEATKGVVVFQHHPLFLKNPDEPDVYFNIPKERRAGYLELFREAKVSAVFAGHYHRNSHGRDGELEMVTTGAVGKPLGEDPSGFRVVTVFEDRLGHVYYGLGEVPETISLRRVEPE